MSSEAEIAWAAGLFEGEGCFTTLGQPGVHGRRTVKAQLGMTDHGVVRRFGEVMGFGLFYVQPAKNGNHVLMWHASRREDFRATVALLWPWLSERRRERATELLELSDLPDGRVHRKVS